MNTSVLIRTADGYLFTGKALFDMRKNAVLFFAEYISPFASNTAFACELYLKYIYSKEHDGSRKRGHNLLDFFDLISMEKRKEIKSDYNKWTSILSFEDCIERHNHTFEDFRYLYEKNNISVEPQSLYNLAVALHNVCYKMEDENNAH